MGTDNFNRRARVQVMGCEFEEHVVDGDLCLAESRAILIYLAKKTKSDLYPNSPKAQAKIDQALYWDQGTFWPKIPAIVVPGIFKGDEEGMMAGIPPVLPVIERLNEMISDEGYVCGAKCTLADISIQGTISALLVLFKYGKDWRKELNIEDKKGIQKWHDNMKKLPGWRELFM